MLSHAQTQMKAVSKLSFTPGRNGLLQRCTATTECDDCRNKRLGLERSSVNQTESSSVPLLVHEVLLSSGQPLDAAACAFMEPRFEHDFSHVVVHTGKRAAESARAVKARAYTVGRHVVFGTGEYAPHTAQGRQLVAHELTHVVQQADASDNVPSRLSVRPIHDRFEQQASSLAENITTVPKAPEKAVPVGGPWVQRQMGEVKEVEARAEEESLEFRLPAADLTVPPKRRPSLFPPGKEPHLKLDPAGFCTQRILAEGTCKDLALGSKYICCDPTSGYKRPGRKTSIEEPGKTCASEKWTPVFTCDNNCETALSKRCDDNDHWMALPPKEFSRAKCNTQYTICANGKRTWGYARDRSATQKSYEVSPGIQKDLDVKVGNTFQGTVYPAGTDDNLIRLNPCCVWPPQVLPERLELQIGEPSLQRVPLGPGQTQVLNTFGDIEDDPIHQPHIEQFRRGEHLPPGGRDETGAPIGPSDAEIKYGGLTLPCPSSTEVATTIDMRSEALAAGFRTAYGIHAQMRVRPDGRTWDGTQIVESLTPGANSCPDTLTRGDPCSGGSTFVVGSQSGNSPVLSGPRSGARNRFWDFHTTRVRPRNVSVLHDALRNPANLDTCSTVCNQEYRCGGNPIGQHTITRTYRKGSHGGQNVTFVDVTKT